VRYILDDHDFRYERYTEFSADESQVEMFILTRFNVVFPNARERGGFVDEAVFRQWCVDRSKVFTKICLPSVLAQSKKPRAWLILFDERYREETKVATDAISAHPWIKAIFVPSKFASLRSCFTADVVEMLSPETRSVVTIRLDNDDALSVSYCQAVLQYVVGTGRGVVDAPYWISFPYGVQWDGSAATLMIMNNNPFLSLVESPDRYWEGKATTALAGNHTHIFDAGLVKTPTPRFPMWLQHIHGANVSNKKNDKFLDFHDARKVLSGFGIGKLAPPVDPIGS